MHYLALPKHTTMQRAAYLYLTGTKNTYNSSNLAARCLKLSYIACSMNNCDYLCETVHWSFKNIYLQSNFDSRTYNNILNINLSILSGKLINKQLIINMVVLLVICCSCSFVLNNVQPSFPRKLFPENQCPLIFFQWYISQNTFMVNYFSKK